MEFPRKIRKRHDVEYEGQGRPRLPKRKAAGQKHAKNRRPPNPLNDRALVLGSLNRPEKQYHDVNDRDPTHPIAHTGSLGPCLVDIPRGVDFGQRIGNSVTVTNINFRGSVWYVPQKFTTATPLPFEDYEFDTIARLVVFVDKMANQRYPHFFQLMQCSYPNANALTDVFSFRNYEFLDRFEILHDQNYTVSYRHTDTIMQEVAGESALYHHIYHRNIVDVSVNIRCNVRVEYAKELPTDQPPSHVTDTYKRIIKNSIGSFWIVERADGEYLGPVTTHRGHWRVKYTDT